MGAPGANMLNQIQQITFIVNNLNQATQLYQTHLKMPPQRIQSTPNGPRATLPAGDRATIQLWQPNPDDPQSAPYRQTRGQGPYQLTLETPDLTPVMSRLTRTGIQFTGPAPAAAPRAITANPAQTHGAQLRIIETAPGNDNPRPPTQPPDVPRLRQIAILVRSLDQAIQQWADMFILQPTQRFHTGFTGLEIAVIPLTGRDTFIELAQPTAPDAPSQKFLQRYGEGLYLTIYQIADSLAMDAHLSAQGARFTTSRQTPNYANPDFNSIWLHPAGFMGAFTQLSQVLSLHNPWPPAGAH